MVMVIVWRLYSTAVSYLMVVFVWAAVGLAEVDPATELDHEPCSRLLLSAAVEIPLRLSPSLQPPFPQLWKREREGEGEGERGRERAGEKKEEREERRERVTLDHS